MRFWELIGANIKIPFLRNAGHGSDPPFADQTAAAVVPEAAGTKVADDLPEVDAPEAAEEH